MFRNVHRWVKPRLNEVREQLKSALWVILLNSAVNQTKALSAQGLSGTIVFTFLLIVMLLKTKSDRLKCISLGMLYEY